MTFPVDVPDVIAGAPLALPLIVAGKADHGLFGDAWLVEPPMSNCTNLNTDLR